jgi:C4-dicarboxylate-specific signal transduction histidine kinase
MSAALAHEVNNPIGALTTYLQAASRMLDRLPGADPRLAGTLAKALAESRRASDVIKTLRNVYGADRLVTATVDVARLCRMVVDQFRSEAERRHVELVLALADRSLAVRGEDFQLLIALRNLVENAIHAAESGPGPERRVTVGAGLASGRVRVTVDDSGTGFAFDGAAPPFPPSPSTKPGGMGLGLAIARRIVDAHGARLQAAPRPGGGTRFEIEFPRPLPVHRGGLT